MRALLLVALGALALLSVGLPFDRPILGWLSQHHTYPANVVAAFVTNIGNPVIILLLGALTVGTLLVAKRRGLALLLALNIFSASLLNEGIKQIVRRPAIQIDMGTHPLPMPTIHGTPVTLPSPSLPRTVYSFPSGHATGSASLLLFVGWLAWRRHWWWLVWGGGILTALVGLSRVYLLTHTVSDVLGGWMVALSCFLLLQIWFRRRSLKPWTG
ncbi:phosphatase PAP2 family protein (plasmid) [Deinococcus sp. KNUC1210]|uniref:phosphatase PAP2 family protein n=1 Tax=Deinococcus sp. KNUC1210 TaxID=2917691 RepID=UPI001EEF7987|nr:phosphatase PAP2 family protein [Deinococcus sp. KNUC1210]ULH18271.1 phosphatase PAP2 family protein [Deinococcus sp. KNUC1210]